jgi:S-adenosylmethionine hydrolase
MRLRRQNILALGLALLCVPPAAIPQQNHPSSAQPLARHTIVFMTDFGLLDDSVAICKAVMLSVDPTARIMDITHQITPYAIADGARFLHGTTPYYPAGTVFIVVVDPGVGSKRKAVVARSKRGHFFVVPDNGLLTLIEDRDGIAEAREITNAEWMIGGKLSSTFHGRDIFSPVAAHIARGDDWTKVGPQLTKLVRLDLKAAQFSPQTGTLSGEVIATDGPYGNLITNIEAAQFASLGYNLGDRVAFNLAGKPHTMRLVRTFSDVPEGDALLFIDSRGRLAIAINLGNAQEKLEVSLPAAVVFQRHKP